MKRWIYLIAVCLLAAVLAVGLCSCNFKGGGDKVDTSPFVSIDQLDFNPKYAEGKGFIIYDSLSFDKIELTREIEKKFRNIKYSLYLGDELLKTVDYSKGKFGSYVFERTGKYTLVASVGDDGVVTQSFEFNVASGGYPTEVEMSLVGEDGARVNNAIAGNKYFVTAKMFSEGEPIVGAVDGLTTYYLSAAQNKGVTKLEKSYPKSKTKVEDEACFITACKNNVGQTISKKFYFKYEVSDNLLKTPQNPLGVYVDMSAVFDGGKKTFDVNATQNGGYFGVGITAEYRYLDGSVEPISVNDCGGVSIPNADSLSTFIKYNDEQEFSGYHCHKDFSGLFSNYVKGTANYQFDAGKTSAEIYMAIKVGDVMTKIDGTEQSFNISSQGVSKFTANKITYSSKNLRNDLYVTGQTKTVVGGVVELWSLVGADTTKQRFSPDINVSGGSFGDYYIEVLNENTFYNGEAVDYYHSADKTLGYFVAKREGNATIRLKSCFTDDAVEINVKVVTPVIDASVSVTSSVNYGYNTPNYKSSVKVLEERYDGTTTSRGLLSGEVYQQYVESFDIDNLVYRNTSYPITIEAAVALYDSVVTRKCLVNYFQIPTLTFSILGQSYTTKSALSADAIYVNHSARDIWSNNPSKNFAGFVPLVRIAVSADSLNMAYSEYGFDVTDGYKGDNLQQNIGRNSSGLFYVRQTDYRNGVLTSSGKSTYAEVPILYVELY